MLPNTLYVPELANTLISIGCLDNAGYTVTFGNGKAKIRYKDGTLMLTLDELHRCMGHISHRAAENLVHGGFVDGVALESNDAPQCETCIFAKMSRKPVPKVRKGEHAKEFGEQIHSDVWGPATVESKGGKRYFVTFTDDHS
ncbi:hypothetical protein GYMLUDRAFT_1006103 [Collybiopsis luxurians FD-317 M1]|uniref:GAG-pre-integrase domain-containing protein n=1 Tax=Collybiopsis luxurians FD-317 M1 TaxID=944289 RepID=A0A0D0BSP7_9AGAR|nr:hypothetical protein GYMLUDRAFT_1006103 [Collybiopsis luxurians FD-317 M1]